MPPPILPTLHPLPARPTSSSAAAAAANAAGLPSRPHTPIQATGAFTSAFGTTSQPASPRPLQQATGSGPGSATGFSHQGSPKLSHRDSFQSQHQTRVEEPLAGVRKAVDKDRLQTNNQLLETGAGWKVKWRAWRGPPLLAVPAGGSSNPPGSSDKASHSSAPSDTTTRIDAESVSANDSGAASTSSRPLKERLQSLHQVTFTRDPIELARKHIARLSAQQSGSQLLSLFSHVKVAAAKGGDNGKGKGKEKERPQDDRDEAAGRLLWAFSLQRVEQSVDDAWARNTLNSLEFPDLTCIGKGHFSHRELFPALYSETPGSTSNSVSPLSLSAASYPSVLALSAAFNADFASSSAAVPLPPAGHSPIRMKAPYEAFLGAVSEQLLVSMLADTTSRAPNSLRPTRLDASIVYLPSTSTPFQSDGRRREPQAVTAMFKLSLQQRGILVQTSVEEVAYRPISSSTPPPVQAPLRLAPYDLAASFITAYSHDLGNGTMAEKAMSDAWSTLLEGTCLSLAPDETWVLCRLQVPTAIAASSSAEQPDALEVVWPASLCLLDGTRPQPPTSPDNSPLRPKAPNLASAAPSPLPAPAAGPTQSASPLPVALTDLTTRRRVASVVSQKSWVAADFTDPVSLRAERVASMLAELNEERERKERNERDAEAMLRATAAAGTPTSTGDPGRAAASSSAPAGQPGLAGAPVNMRTPISLGGSSTEAPSPADGLAGIGMYGSGGMFGFGGGAGLGGSTTGMDVAGLNKPVDLDQLYPSPTDVQPLATVPEASQAGSADVIMSNSDHGGSGEGMDSGGFPDFDWGEHFAGGRGNAAGIRNQDFDDGMLMGLTDDDFSFFDDPAPLPVSSMPMGGLQSSGPSPKFVDHFSHLSAATPFASAASPSSPFGQPSPHIQASPNLGHFGFDTSHNALGLGSSVNVASADLSHHKTPRTPFTPFLDVQDDAAQQTGDATHTPTAFSIPSISVAGTPDASQSTPSRRHHQFDAVVFGSSHTQSDDKYDSRKGKFGLPSPDWERDTRPLEKVAALVLARRDVTRIQPQKPTVAPWFAFVGDPRLAVAKQLKRKRAASIDRRAMSLTKSGGSGPGRDTYYKMARGRRWLTQEAAMSDLDEQDTDDDGDEVDDGPVDEDGETAVRLDGSSSIKYTFGAGLLLLRRYATALLAPREEKPVPAPTLSKALTVADSQLESALALAGDQTLNNPDYRNRPLSAVGAVTTVAPVLISSHGIKLVYGRLAAILASSKAAQDADLPPLALQPPPTILIRAQQSIVELNTNAKQFWRPMGFEPLAGGKDVTAFAIFEEGGPELAATVAKWLGNVSEVYESLRLGKHSLGAVPANGSFGSVQDGLASLPAGVLTSPRTREELKSIAAHLLESARHRKHVVIYLLAPLEACANGSSAPVIFALQQIFKSKTPNMSIVIYPLPITTIARGRHMHCSDSATRRLDRLAFSVYDQLLIPVSSLNMPVPDSFPSANYARHPSLGPVTRLFQSPALTVAPARNHRTEFELSWPPTSLEIEHRHRLLHISYACSSSPASAGAERMVVSCIDEKGEVWKTLPRILRFPPGAVAEVQRVRQVWSIAQLLAGTADVEWRVVISKLGFLNEAEMKAWDALLKDVLPAHRRPLHVTLVAVDLAPPVAVLERVTVSRAREHSEEGEVGAADSATKRTHLDTQSSIFTFTPAEPVTLPSSPTLIAPATSYVVYIPRIASLTHTSVDAFMPSSPAVSVFGVHFLISQHSKTSSLSIPLRQHVQDVTRSFIELAALGETRWGASGRLPWPLEACKCALGAFEEEL